MNEMTSRPHWARDPLLETLASRTSDWMTGRELVLEDLCLGLPISWAIVRDAKGRRAMGTALTPANEGGDQDLRYPGLSTDWRDWTVQDLPGRIMADHPLERCLALAVINAVSQYRLALEELAGVELRQARGSVVRWVVEQRPERLVMIGNMGPLVNGLKEAGVPLAVFERNPGNRSGAYGDAQEWAWLERADGLILTGATLVNHTLAPLIALAGQARFRLLVGFSAQVHPAFLAGSGIQRVFSLHIRDIDRVRRQLQIGNWDAMFDSEAGYIADVDGTPAAVSL